MKYLFLLLLSTNVYAKEYSFNWKFPNGTMSYKTNADSWKTAFDRAAVYCYKNLIKQTVFSENVALEVIDICANPR